MKIVLVYPPFYLESMYNLAPLGLINLATALKNTPHQVVIMDFVLAIRQRTLKMGNNIYGECAERILGEAPDLVGFSAQCTTSPAVVQISRKIRNKRPDVKIVVGGDNASLADRITLERYPFVDGIVWGEGELTFPALVSAYKSGKNEEGIPGWVPWMRNCWHLLRKRVVSPCVMVSIQAQRRPYPLCERILTMGSPRLLGHGIMESWRT